MDDDQSDNKTDIVSCHSGDGTPEAGETLRDLNCSQTSGCRPLDKDDENSVERRSSSGSSRSSGKIKTNKLRRRGAPSSLEGSHWKRLKNTLRAANGLQTMTSEKKRMDIQREDSFLKRFSTRNQRIHQTPPPDDEHGVRQQTQSRKPKLPRHFVAHYNGQFMFYWLGMTTLAVLYNLWSSIAREAFREIQESSPTAWFVLDALCDVVYMLDIFVQFRTGYLDQGLMVYDSKKLAKQYMSNRHMFCMDVLCLLPLDLVQLYIGIHPMVRFPRFIKVYRTFGFLHMLESKSAYPNFIRVANLTHMLFLGSHWFAAFYYLISEAEDFKGKWSYPRPEGEYATVTRKYLASLFWSTLTLTTIGDLPPPDSNWEYVFVIVSYLIGVFIFATIVGQVGNIITNRNASRQEFERLLDGAKLYMATHSIPPDLSKRVQRWYDYVWSRGRLNGYDINSIQLLPDKLKTELAIYVNLETLKKVTIFQECQPEFLHDLVLKMKAFIFTPGDLICRVGEVAREMFIVADGMVEVISANGIVLKRMAAGDFFGEIGILNLDGGINRRTADVRSVGYSELFVVSREDVLNALKDHPDAESIIRDYGQRRLREVEAHRVNVKPLKQLDVAVSHSPSGYGDRDSNTFARKKDQSFSSEIKPFDSEVTYTNATSIFHRAFGTLRRLFHRKVRRQKGDDVFDLENKTAWVAEDNCKVNMCSESSRLPKITRPAPSGYTAVDTEDKDVFKNEMYCIENAISECSEPTDSNVCASDPCCDTISNLDYASVHTSAAATGADDKAIESETVSPKTHGALEVFKTTTSPRRRASELTINASGSPSPKKTVKSTSFSSQKGVFDVMSPKRTTSPVSPKTTPTRKLFDITTEAILPQYPPSPIPSSQDAQLLGKQIQNLGSIIETKMESLETLYTASLERLEKITAVQESLLNLVQESLRQQVFRGTSPIVMDTVDSDSS
ncbi:cyclic nucleotide-gated channel rod photoreceptor subunit alpha-like [Gigantopelta aegis]|uniref:cyclic nucleotide-gated channel rod photoreceptor subunit alpha-like n=1 Tax=Gigantopelta aegis TaxID=1735272 RepID=UPI001B8885C2|nr:cyclic nucleotide-gated channel rod photoreceptor subunit alpha-like [Gigantopelta aegis]